MKKSVIICALLISTLFGQVDVSQTPATWIGQEFGNESGTLSITNNTNIQRQIDGVRATFPGANIATNLGISPMKKITAVTDGNGPNRFDVQLSSNSGGTENDNLPINIFNPGSKRDIVISTTTAPDGGDWTPHSPQIIVLGGKSIAEEKPVKEFPGITLAQLDSIRQTDEFYDSTLHVLDTLGIHGAPEGGGFTDSWFNQVTEKPIWQIQVGQIPHIVPEVDPANGTGTLDTFNVYGATWYDQPNGEYKLVGNQPYAFMPDSMDLQDAAYGTGPLYMMGAAMTQEYMSIDMQFMLASGFKESLAGTIGYAKDGTAADTVWDTVQVPADNPLELPYWDASKAALVFAGDIVLWAPNGNYYKAKVNNPTQAPDQTWQFDLFWENTTYTPSGATKDSIFVKEVVWGVYKPNVSAYGAHGIGYYNRNQNQALTLGPNHFIEASYGSYCLEGYPKYFPYDKTGHSSEYINSSTGGTGLNSPHISNAYLITGLYYWYTWQLGVASHGQDMFDWIAAAENREVGAQMVIWAWNKGFNGNYKTFVDDPNRDGSPSAILDLVSDYVRPVWNSVNYLEKANENSSVVGGPYPVYDGKISKKNIEDQFFGEGGSGTTGVLGSGGILQHFLHTDAERQKIWDTLEVAFDMLKGNAPSTQGTDSCSFRYDYLALLRIVKPYLDLTVPVPKGEEFKNWTTDPELEINPIDDIAPYLAQSNKGAGSSSSGTFHKTFTVSDEADMPDSAGIRGVSWTMNSNWSGWMDATELSPGVYDIEASQLAINTFIESQPSYPASDTVVAWVRVSDVNNNELIDSFKVWRVPLAVGATAPTFDSAGAYDTDGDGQADNVTLFISTVTGGDLLNQIQDLEFSWPTTGALQTPTPTFNSSSITLTHTALTGGAGSGEVRFSYPSQSGYIETIQDRVGPALSGSATLNVSDENRLFDTLTFTVSEQLAANLTGTQYLQFAVDTTGATSSETLQSFSQGSATFTKGTITTAGYKWVRLAEANGATDVAGNTPASNSRWVPLQIIGGKEPLFEKAVLFDRNGDGIGDSLFVEITLGTVSNRYTIDSLLATSSFNWNSEGAVTFGLPVVVSKTDSTLSIVNESLTAAQKIKSGGGSGTLALNFPGGYILTGTIEDSVGPAARGNATVYAEEESRTNDTLVIKVTEELSTAFLTDHIYVELSTDSGATVQVSLETSQIQYHGVDSVVLVMPKDFNTPTSYTWVRLVSTGGVQDLAGNTPSPQSQWVPLTIRGGRVPTVVEAALFDRSLPRNGSGDAVELALSLSSMPDFFTADSLVGASVTWNGQTVSATFTVNSATSLSLTLADGVLEGTSGTGEVTLLFPDNKTVVGTLSDSIAPVIEKATYAPGQGTDGVLIDTLILVFSEALTSYNGIPGNIEYTNEYNGLYTLPFDSIVAVSPNTINCYTTVTATSISPANGDSLHLVAGVATISDGNNDLSEATEWIALTVNPYIYNFNVAVYPNPHSVNRPKDNTNFFASLGYSPSSQFNSAIVVEAIGNRQLQSDLVGKVVVFDALGNVVLSEEEMTFVPSSSKLVAEFSGYNDRGRKLQSGVYHAVISIDGVEEPLRTNIGVVYRKSY